MGKNLILCGFMGCGKTRVGKILRKETGREFIDLDHHIERQQKMKVSKIFEQKGEKYFRQLENKTVRELAGREDLIIACGGGTVLTEENVIAFHEGGGVIVFLNVPVRILQDRLRNDKKRPLLQIENRSELIRDLYKERYPIYRSAADVTIYAGMPAQMVTKRLLRKRLIRSCL